VAALAESSGNRTRAAALLGLSRQSLLYEMKKLKLG
jgi:transcriptional regulator with PAS, ATPase and Fis domain